jgi:large subunit ribosomal protein L24
MASAHVRKGDTVMVVAGKERGKRGKVLRVIPEKSRVIVEKVNMIKRHQRPTQKLRQGGIIEREGPIHLSNVMLMDPRGERPTRVGVRMLADGKKVRVARKSGEIIDKA